MASRIVKTKKKIPSHKLRMELRNILKREIDENGFSLEVNLDNIQTELREINWVISRKELVETIEKLIRSSRIRTVTSSNNDQVLKFGVGW